MIYKRKQNDPEREKALDILEQRIQNLEIGWDDEESDEDDSDLFMEDGFECCIVTRAYFDGLSDEEQNRLMEADYVQILEPDPLSEEEREEILDCASDMLMSDDSMVFGDNYSDYLPYLHDFACRFYRWSDAGKTFFSDYLNNVLKERGLEPPFRPYLYWGGRFFVLPDLPRTTADKKVYAKQAATDILNCIGTNDDVSREEIVEYMIEAALLDNLTLAFRCDYLDSMVCDQEGVPVDRSKGLYTYLPNGKVLSLAEVFDCGPVEEPADAFDTEE